ncbi:MULTISPECIES: 4,5:9,10-diseco-3-hydroxy-5,9,17-trioxoandrosta-1(10),2-diene-4-oate hydrolase [Streptomyces]|uniref:Alpha/beta fold hydrolase n=1 Tax=Streptomyces xanthii TaxID=2768069 RepID=A0A7H1BDK8_9ACTN|nr:4,5:9,10-diseco-3-hydroxy-5,9,17-trioxoandrosta-1(10),2-diene-4-oate hydrolase [Streptomyces xanthii]QNS06813.1 alpha/beta fold hydrolase [Streptomyces xanthii]
MTTALTAESTRRTVKAGGHALAYHEAGPADGPVVVMLHGGGPGASGWSNFGANLAPFAAAGLRTILLDQLCFGDSDKPELDTDYWTASARATVALLDELGIAQAHFVGNSLGGGTAARLALDFPDRVGKLLLMGPGGVTLNLFHADPTEGIQRLFDFNMSPEPTRDQMRAFLSVLAYDRSIVTDAFVEERYLRALDPEVRLGAARMGAAFANPAWTERTQLWRDAHRITHPTLLTWGREDRVNPIDGAFVALKAMPNARLHVFPHCGHWAQTEQADEFNRLAIDFFTH